MLVPCSVVGGLRSRKDGSPTGAVLPLPGGVHIHPDQAGNRCTLNRGTAEWSVNGLFQEHRQEQQAVVKLPETKHSTEG